MSIAATPILGSPMVFPQLFDRRVVALVAGSSSADLNPRIVHRYFGALLRLRVDPSHLQQRISDVVSAQGRCRWVGASFLDAADWSGALAPIDRSPIHREVSELVSADLDFRSTRAYRALKRAARKGRPARRNGKALSDVGQIEAYFRYCADLIESMRAKGIVPRGDFRRAERGWFKHRDVRPAAIDSAERDVGVAINENGELIRHLGGKHRTAIAQALKLPSIPVELRMVHVGWLADEMRRTGLPAHQALKAWLQAFPTPPP